MEKNFNFTGQSVEKILENAVRNAKSFRGTTFRWGCVALALGCQKDTAIALCKHFNLNPNDGVTR